MNATLMHLSRDAGIVVRERAMLLVHAATIRRAADRLPLHAANPAVRPVFESRSGLTLKTDEGRGVVARGRGETFELKMHVVAGGDLADVLSVSIHENDGADGSSVLSLEMPIERNAFGEDGMKAATAPSIAAARMRRFADALETARMSPPGVHPKALLAALAWSATRPEEPAWTMIVPACEFLPETRAWDFNMRAFVPEPRHDPPPRIEISEISSSIRTIDGRTTSSLRIQADAAKQLVHLSRLGAVERLRILSTMEEEDSLPPSEVETSTCLPY